MIKLTRRDIRINQPLSWDVFDESGTLLLRRGYVIETPTQFYGLIERGLYVMAQLRIAATRAPAAEREIAFDPFCLWDDMHSNLVRVLRDVETDDMVEDKLTGIALLVGVLVDKDPDAALGAILLKDSARYAYTHALHVAVMAAIVSKKLAWRDDERRDLLCAALSMNVAMMELQTQLLEQKEPLTKEQRHAIDTHPMRGHDLLLRKGVGNQRWLDTVRLHHERQQLTASALTNPSAAIFAELLRTLDIFCAKISPRTYRQAKLPSAAAREIFAGERDSHNVFLGPVIKEVGLYMPGTFLQLENGDVALAIKRGANVNAPKVMALSRKDGMPYMEPVRRDTAQPEFAVKRAITKESVLYRLNLSRMWGYAS